MPRHESRRVFVYKESVAARVGEARQSKAMLNPSEARDEPN